MMLDGEPPISTTRDQRFCVQNPSVLRPRHWSHTMSEAAPPETLQLPAGTVTFLLTDIEGSTALWQEAPEEMAMAVARHHELLEEVVAAHAGVRPEEQGEGDSIVAAFSRASDAVHAALHAQRCSRRSSGLLRVQSVYAWPCTPANHVFGEGQLCRDGGDSHGASMGCVDRRLR